MHTKATTNIYKYRNLKYCPLIGLLKMYVNSNCSLSIHFVLRVNLLKVSHFDRKILFHVSDLLSYNNLIQLGK